jgi:hypothetical protein
MGIAASDGVPFTQARATIAHDRSLDELRTANSSGARIGSNHEPPVRAPRSMPVSMS